MSVHDSWRVDAREKVTGQARFAADLHIPGQLIGKVWRSGQTHARIVSLDATEAKKIPGVVKIMLAGDMPAHTTWSTYPFLAQGRVLYQGDAVALVAAESEEAALAALAQMEAVYEALPPVLSLDEALEESAPILHNSYPDNRVANSHWPVRKGNIREGFEQSDLVLEREYRTSHVEHAYIEPEAVVVMTDWDGSLIIYGSTQNPFNTRRAVAAATGYPLNKVRVVQQAVGGSFGGKEESVGLLAGRASVLCLATGRPVKMTYSREESVIESSKRHPFRFRYKVGAKRDGRLMALQAELVDEGGAYNFQAQFMNWRACVHAAGVYHIPNVEIDVYAVHTNHVFGGAMRGYSSPQIIFAQESLMDELAAALGLEPLALRRLNFLREGDETITGQILHEPVNAEKVTLRALDLADYERKKEAYRRQDPDTRQVGGIGFATCFRGCGLGAEAPDATGAILSVQEDGSIVVRSSLTDMGQGLQTAHAQLVARELGVSPARIVSKPVDTSLVPEGGMTVASRGTYSGGKPILQAVARIKQILLHVAAQKLECSAGELAMANDCVFRREDPSQKLSFAEVASAAFWSGHSLSVTEWFQPGPLRWERETGQGEAFPSYTYSCVVAEVSVDRLTGKATVTKLVSVHDAGRVVHAGAASGQVYGGMAMGVGMALMEGLNFERGLVTSTNFDRYLIPTAADIPEAVFEFLPSDGNSGAAGAKSLGEATVEAVPAAVANALAAAGYRLRTLPALSESLLKRERG
ncbi:Aldehyde oxidase and xanthine dehydrogenase, a/b hammerhead domain protein [Acididesulfobacillus acetoxydans]|uniref:Aldehyde oxidase and xanthine dehydrogenase, a/b hammerhead domain protein n=1 Tax=Acididesulfobacillus acetoxydans TaxID=1561005 RepID=A0A8S0VWM6_9FIRM|nr:xanthine dehydrogenase family protein molybdopterin-binding subunit [Acididesulfobacillus acetoxydans]CAA7601033.1 Aldehyde oxidase and xanthine dehydrogenase, a/b hammerhead domain protein [Acididesulfobacillus acetoxydans]CEJ06907.1 Nicotinate dehydrogenase large molybdopterin subunit [Acididesulfobacillus acetoxydans]